MKEDIGSLERMARTMLAMDPVKPLELKMPDSVPPQGMVRCACNKKNIPHEEVRYYNTGVVSGASDSICKECLVDVKNHGLIVCVGCKAVVARLPPGELQSGFRIESGKCYHTDACPNCKPNIVKSVLIEDVIFKRARK